MYEGRLSKEHELTIDGIRLPELIAAIRQYCMCLQLTP